MRTTDPSQPADEQDPSEVIIADEAPAEDVPEGTTEVEDGTVAEGPELTAKDYDRI